MPTKINPFKGVLIYYLASGHILWNIFIFIFQRFIIYHTVLHILLFYCAFLIFSGFDQLTQWSLILRLKDKIIWNASCKGKLYYLICLQNRIKVKIYGKKLLNFSLVPQKRFLGGRMGFKNLIRWVNAKAEENYDVFTVI